MSNSVTIIANVDDGGEVSTSTSERVTITADVTTINNVEAETSNATVLTNVEIIEKPTVEVNLIAGGAGPQGPPGPTGLIGPQGIPGPLSSMNSLNGLIGDVTISGEDYMTMTPVGQNLELDVDPAALGPVIAPYIQNATQILAEVPTGLVNSSNVTYTLSNTPHSGTLALYRNGLRQKVGGSNDYTLSGATITMVTAPLTGDVLTADYWVIDPSTYTQGVSTLDTSRVPVGTVNGTNTTFTTPNVYVAGTLEVFINGVKQAPTTHYTETTPSSGIFTMSDAPLTGDNILVNYQRVLVSAGDAASVGGYTIESIFNIMYPVGYVYTSVVNTNPGTLLGFGTWVVFATGRMIVGVDTGDADFNTVEETGGQKDVKAHTHASTNNAFFPSGTGSLAINDNTGDRIMVTDNAVGGTSWNANFGTTSSTGAGTTNMNPYITAYMWKRTA